MGFAKFLPFAIVHFAVAALQRGQPLAGCFPGIHVLFEKTALIQQLALHCTYPRDLSFGF
jgi:hypothetical protein